MHTHTHRYTLTHAYTYAHTYIHTHTSAHAHTYMYAPWPLIAGLGAAEISLVYEEGLLPPSRWRWVFDLILSHSISTSSPCLKGVQRAELGS